jgi:3-oxoacyl-[acyl-carrier-protein] synthase II
MTAVGRRADDRLPAVVVTGVGLRCALGSEVEVAWRRILAGETGLRPWPDLAEEGFRITVAARVVGEAPDPTGRGAWMAAGAAADALAMAGLAGGSVPGAEGTPGWRNPPEDGGASPSTGIFLGTTMGESAAYEAAAHPGGPTPDLERVTGRGIARTVGDTLGLPLGPRRGYATACAAGNHALGAAVEAVARGEVARAVAGGVDPFSRIAMAGFSRVRAMDPELCRPFDVGRRGMQLGEGAALLVLEREADARARGALPLARIHPCGLSCDAYHPTAPHPEGRGMARAMEMALERAGLPAAEIGWVCAHGTGTPGSDAAEARAILRVLGADAPPPVSSPKAALGHTMGAAGAFGALLAVLALRHGTIPPTVTLRDPDPSLELDLPLGPRPAPGLRAVLNCGYAFGGINAVMVVEAA